MNSKKQLQRIEAFSDGVFAIACTLLVLDLKVPHLEEVALPGALWSALQGVWPNLVAFIISFGTIYVAWAGHRRMMNLLADSSTLFLLANAFLLLTITFIPFPTAVLAEYINTPQANTATMFYCAGFSVVWIGFNALWQSMLHPQDLFVASAPRAFLDKYSFRLARGLVIFVLATILAYWFPIVAIIIFTAHFALWVFEASDKEERAFLDTPQLEAAE
jgi:uncharacterized membrane protein